MKEIGSEQRRQVRRVHLVSDQQRSWKYSTLYQEHFEKDDYIYEFLTIIAIFVFRIVCHQPEELEKDIQRVSVDHRKDLN